MPGEDTRAVVCDSCSRLISMADATCPYCGAVRVGARASSRLRDWIRERSVVDLLFVTIIAVYLASVVLSGRDALSMERGFWQLLGPRSEVLGFLGSCDAWSVLHYGEVWRLVTAAFLHAGLVHIAFNLSFLRQVGPFVEEEFGPIRFTLVWMGSAIAGSIAVVAVRQSGVGASGAAFGLLGAGFAYGKRRGGTFGQEMRGIFGRWLVYGLAFTFVVPGISIPAHIGGLVGGLALGWVLTPRAKRSASRLSDPPWMTLLAAALLASVPISFALSVGKGLLAPSPRALDFILARRGVRALDTWPLRRLSLDDIGAKGWSVELPLGWESVVDSQGLTSDGAEGVNFALRVVQDFGATGVVERSNPEKGFSTLTVSKAISPRSAVVLMSSCRPDVDRAAWKVLFERVAESLRGP
ncbi:MAG TPA: rhomboid family intramembrane serine protease [Planctomycetota bacterium]|nr:rhomboid family intramembrane serine protease [Planctomycetota bacterium]